MQCKNSIQLEGKKRDDYHTSVKAYRGGHLTL